MNVSMSSPVTGYRKGSTSKVRCIDVAALATSVGAVADRLYSPATATADAARAYRTAQRQRRTVVLAMPLDVQAAQCEPPKIPPV